MTSLFAAGCAVALLSGQASAPVTHPLAPLVLIEAPVLNQAFLAHLDKLGPTNAVAAARVRDGWPRYSKDAPENFIPDALAELFPALRAALEAFDQGRMESAVAQFEPLTRSTDPYVAAHALYYGARALSRLGRYEEAEALLRPSVETPDQVARHTPLAAALFYLRGYCQARNLRFEEATGTLDALRQAPNLPEPVRLGARQTLLEIERRQVGTLDEVALVMTYVADRLASTDRADRVGARQQEVIALLDKLIEQEQSQEQQGGGGGKSQGQRPGPPQAAQNSTPREQSEAPDGAGQIGDLHAAPTIQPGESWGSLPPADRERILQNIREHYPSRYRQLVEQYYRSLAEDK